VKKNTKTIAYVATIILLAQLGIADAESTKVVTPSQVVQDCKAYDIEVQIDNMESNLKRLRAAYTPSGAGLGGGPWAITYRLSIAPLFSDIQQKADDFQIANEQMNNEYLYYDNAYKYWLLSQTARYKLENLSLSQHERDMTKKKLELGLASQTELLQAEISVNNAQSDFDKINLQKQNQMYQINQTMGSAADTPLNVDSEDLSFLSADELNVDQTLINLYQTHRSLESLKALLEANQKAQSIAAGQTDINVPAQNLIDYYNLEIEEAQLKLKQQRQRLEIASRSYLEQAKTLESAIKLDQDNVEKVKKVYDNSVKTFELGMITYSEMESVRMKLLATNLQLSSDQKDYLTLKEKLKLFKSGALFTIL